MSRTVTGDREIVVELRPGIRVIRSSEEPDSFAIEQGIVSKARAKKKKQRHDPILAINPARPLSESHIGTLRDLRNSVDSAKVYKVNDTSMWRAMLGPIGAQEVGRITVHVPYPAYDQIESFTTWIPTKLLQDELLKEGVTVAFALETVNVPSHGYTWFCSSIKALG